MPDAWSGGGDGEPYEPTAASDALLAGSEGVVCSRENLAHPARAVISCSLTSGTVVCASGKHTGGEAAG